MEEYLGIIKIFGGNFAPRGWMMCNGQILSIAQNTALFSLLGTTYGGNGQTTFALPNLQSRLPVGMGQGPGLSMYVQGQLGGTENNTLTLANLPAHNHQVIGNLSVKANANAANADTPEGAYMAPSSAQIYNDAAAGSFMAADTVSINLPTTVAGNNNPVNNLAPYIGMNYIICISGIYPSRN